jgi:hypothetical protein
MVCVLCSAHDPHLTPTVGTAFLNKGSGTRIPMYAFNIFAELGGANSIMRAKANATKSFDSGVNGLDQCG